MARASKSGKRSKKNKPSHIQYNNDKRWEKNKVRDIIREIKRCKKILERNPESNIGRNITDLKTLLKEKYNVLNKDIPE